MIASKVISGVTALMIPAKIEVTSVSATANRIPGITFSKSETTHKWRHVDLSRGSRKPITLSAINNVIAPKAQRPNATPNGVRNSRPNLIKINEQPQTTPKAM
jgi:hypothetical protein